jgi:hypothetical protein
MRHGEESDGIDRVSVSANASIGLVCFKTETTGPVMYTTGSLFLLTPRHCQVSFFCSYPLLKSDFKDRSHPTETFTTQANSSVATPKNIESLTLRQPLYIYAEHSTHSYRQGMYEVASSFLGTGGNPEYKGNSSSC